MGRGKIKRKSTSIDMTAMCDVAFLLLSFFILTAQFKPSEAVPVNIPNSVHSVAAKLNTDAFVVSVTQDGKTILELSDAGIRHSILQKMEDLKGFQLSPAQVKAFDNEDYIPVSVNDLPQFLSYTPDQLKKVSFPGIPLDSTGGELRDWITAGLQAYNNDTKAIHFIIKGDNSAKYPNIGNVLSAFKRNEVYKYQLLTSPEAAPPGTELFKKQQAGKPVDEE
jgi:biopolymer transport protein ExbD